MDLSAKFPVRLLQELEILSQQLHNFGLYALACGDEETAAVLRQLSDRLETHRFRQLLGEASAAPTFLPEQGGEERPLFPDPWG